MTDTQRKMTERALRKVQKCDGDCKHCEHLIIPAIKNVYCFLCGAADRAGYRPYSDTMRDLRAITLECLEFELK